MSNVQGPSMLFDLGRVMPGNRDEPVSITPLALRTSRGSNAVSKRHGEVARAMWHPLYPGRSLDAVPVTHVTNGVHTLTWMAGRMQAFLDRHLGPNWRQRQSDPGLWADIDAIPDAEIWAVRCALRADLVEYARERSMRDRLSRGEPPEYVEAAARTLDVNTLTVGFARRMATYKRFYLLSRSPELGLRLLADPHRPIQILVAGKAHPQDQDAKDTLHTFFQLEHAPLVGSHVAFIEDYDLHSAPRIVAGVDLWLNLPRPPMEASGTSGMKVTLNGGINLSVLDGWWIEGYDGENGWAIDSPDGDPHAQDEHDTQALYHLMEREVVPLFYDRDENGIPRGWVRRIKRAMRTLIPRFTAERMVRDYVGQMYKAGG